MGDVRVRALQAADRAAAHALIARQFGGTRYAARMLEQVTLARDAGANEECTGLVATMSGTDALAGLVLFGAVAGALQVVKVHAVCGENAPVLRALLSAACAACARARMMVCELPDDACFRLAHEVLAAGGFVSEGTVPAYFAEDVCALILVFRQHAALGDYASPIQQEIHDHH